MKKVLMFLLILTITVTGQDYLSLSGGTMDGNINMDGKNITNSYLIDMESLKVTNDTYHFETRFNPTKNAFGLILGGGNEPLNDRNFFLTSYNASNLPSWTALNASKYFTITEDVVLDYNYAYDGSIVEMAVTSTNAVFPQAVPKGDAYFWARSPDSRRGNIHMLPQANNGLGLLTVHGSFNLTNDFMFSGGDINISNDVNFNLKGGDFWVKDDTGQTALYVDSGSIGSNSILRLLENGVLKWQFQNLGYNDNLYIQNGAESPVLILEQSSKKAHFYGELMVEDLNTGSNIGSQACIDSVGRLCLCGNCS